MIITVLEDASFVKCIWGKFYTLITFIESESQWNLKVYFYILLHK